MKEVFFVQSSESDNARRIEQILISLPKEAGILFVGVSVAEDPFSLARRVIYQIVVGCDRSREIRLIEHLVKNYLRTEVDVSQLSVQVYRGINR